LSTLSGKIERADCKLGMSEHSTTDDAETIYVDIFLAQLLQLAKCSTAKSILNLEHLVRVQHCTPCERCGAPVARVRLAGEVHTVDCLRDGLGNPHLPRWNADLCSDHECEAHQ
jgi:hypothetical protein